jgi:hypothetical protein
MLRVNYKRPEEMPSHHRDFPERSDGERLRAGSASQGLGLLVAGYLVAMFAGILLLSHLTRTSSPAGAAAMAASKK